MGYISCTVGGKKEYRSKTLKIFFVFGLIFPDPLVCLFKT